MISFVSGLNVTVTSQTSVILNLTLSSPPSTPYQFCVSPIFSTTLSSSDAPTAALANTNEYVPSSFLDITFTGASKGLPFQRMSLQSSFEPATTYTGSATGAVVGSSVVGSAVVSSVGAAVVSSVGAAVVSSVGATVVSSVGASVVSGAVVAGSTFSIVRAVPFAAPSAIESLYKPSNFSVILLFSGPSSPLPKLTSQLPFARALKKLFLPVNSISTLHTPSAYVKG